MSQTAGHKTQIDTSGRESANLRHTSKNHFFLKNKTHQSFFQKKPASITAGEPDDKYEKEAEDTAEKVVQRLIDYKTDHQAFFYSNNGNTDIQKKCETCEEEVQAKASPEGSKDLPKVLNIQANHGLNTQIKHHRRDCNPALSSSIVQNHITQKNAPESEEIDLKEEEYEEEPEKTLQKKFIQKKRNGLSVPVEKDISSQLSKSDGKGSPMNGETRQQMEHAFDADFSGVRIHTGSDAIGMSQSLQAQAFTHGNNIYFNEGKYKPDSHSGRHLLAHELTHTIQQGASVQKKGNEVVAGAPKMLQALGVIDLIPDWIIEDARQIPGYTLFTVVLGYDPLREVTVERTPVNLIEGLMGLVPFGTYIFDKLQEYGVLQRAFEWVNGQLERLQLTTQGLLDLLEEAWDELEFPYDDAIDVITRKFQTLLNRIERFALGLVDQLINWIKEALIDVVEPVLEENRAWSLIKKILHYDPLRDQQVEATTVEILEDFLLLIDKQTELEQMRERGTLQETANWLDTQLATFMTLAIELRGIITNVWEAIQPENLPNLGENIQLLSAQVTGLIQRAWTFATTVAGKVLEIIKNALLSWLNSFAADIPGFTLLTFILGRNPLTGEVVPGTIENIIRGFMGLIPGGEAKFQELKQSGVIPRAATQIEALIAQLGFSWEAIVQLFTNVWQSLTIYDLTEPLAAFERVTARFRQPISSLFTFVTKVVRVLVELVLEIMGIPPDMIANIISNAMQAFEDIKKDPIGFLLNLMNAVKEGFLKFLNNIGTHLLNGFQDWLFGTLASTGIHLPPDLSIRSILGLAMDVLGITLDNILDRLALKIGEERVAQIRNMLDKLSGIWAFVKDVIERGPVAIWLYIQEKISNLWNVIKDGIMSFIQEKVIQQAITWLLSFLDVTGIMPVIRGVQTVFNAITSFVEKLREILGIVKTFVAGVADIAKGSIQTAASFLETALADGIPVAISFLAKQLGLGDISEKIQEMIENVRGMINEGIDWLIDKALAAGTAFLNVLGLGGGTQESEESSNDDPEVVANVAQALETIPAKESGRLEGGQLSFESAQEVAAEMRREYSFFTVFEVVDGTDSWDYHYLANPENVYGDDEQRPEKKDSDISFNVNDLFRDIANDNYFKVESINIESGQISLSPLNTDAYAMTINISTLQNDIDSGIWTKLTMAGNPPVNIGDLIKAPYKARTGSFLAYIVESAYPELVAYQFKGQNGTHATSFERFITKLSQGEIIVIRVDRAFLRSLTPSREIQSDVQSQLSINDPDPAFPDLTVDETPQAEHIIPFEKIISIPGFELLTAEQQIHVLNLRINFVALSRRANASKGTKSYSQWRRHESLGMDVNPNFRRRMIIKEERARQAILDTIDDLIKENTI